MGWNQDIKPNDSISFGFTASYDEELSEPDDYYMTRVCQEVTDDYDAYYKIDNKWDYGCVGKIIIRNNSDREIEDWKISFDTNLIIKSIWNAQIGKYYDSKYYVNNSGYNSNIKPHESVEIGFEASFKGDIEIKNILLYNMSMLIDDSNYDYGSNLTYEEIDLSDLEADIHSSKFIEQSDIYNKFNDDVSFDELGDFEYSNNEKNTLLKNAPKYSKAQLKKDIKELVKNDVSLKIVRTYSSDQAIDIILGYNNTINEAAKKYGVNKALIQAVLLRELTCINASDDLADIAVMNYYNYKQQLENYSKKPWYIQIIIGTPEPKLPMREDSSTGYGQIFAKTGINARNATLQKGEAKMYYSKWKQRKTMWYKLKDNKTYNITMVARVLKMETKNLKLSSPLENISLVLSRYNNGTTKKATQYGEICNRYYKLFKKYNG